MSDLVLAPYLPLSETTRCGPWRLIPFRDVAADHALPAEIADAVTRLVTAYRQPSGGGAVLGAVAHPHDARIGVEVDRGSIPRLSHALLAGTLSSNPNMVTDKEASPNAGHHVSSTENAVVYGHPNITPQSYVIETGVLVNTTHWRTAEGGEPLPPVQPPVELPQPLFGSFDHELSDATFAALDSSEPGRRLHRTLDWYRIIFSNAEAVTFNVRVGAARSALEILCDIDTNETKKLVRAYRALVGDDSPATRHDDVFWAKGPVDLTADEWWLTRLSELRNAIVHGDAIDDDLRSHHGHHQLDHIHDRFLGALRVVVSQRAGDPLLAEHPKDRVFSRLAQEMARRLSGEPDSE